MELQGLRPEDIWDKIVSSYNKKLKRCFITFDNSINNYNWVLEKLLHDIKNKSYGILINLSSYYLLTVWKEKKYSEKNKLYYIEDNYYQKSYIIDDHRKAIIIALEIFFKNINIRGQRENYDVYIWEYDLIRGKLLKDFECKSTLIRIMKTLSMCKGLIYDVD